jgi:hypothetical protein
MPWPPTTSPSTRSPAPLKQQQFASADGTGRQWLAVQYEYRR